VSLLLCLCTLVDRCGFATSGVARERYDASLEAGLVAVRPVHVSEFGVRGHRATAGTDGNERAVAAFLPGGEHFEPGRGLGAPGFLPPVDVTGREFCVAGESWTRVERAVGPDRLRVLAMNLARPHVHAVDGGESPLLGLFTEKRHLLVEEVAVVADAGAPARRRHACAVQRFS